MDWSPSALKRVPLEACDDPVLVPNNEALLPSTGTRDHPRDSSTDVPPGEESLLPVMDAAAATTAALSRLVEGISPESARLFVRHKKHAIFDNLVLFSFHEERDSEFKTRALF